MPSVHALGEAMKFALKEPFARDRSTDGGDVRLMKQALNRLGYYTPPAGSGITDIPDSAVFVALKKFQGDKGVPLTGTVKPGDVTVQAFKKELGKKKQTKAYVWRTVKDDRVRDSHAAREGTIRLWSESPDPAEEINCRCWAEKVRLRCFKATGWQNAALGMIKKNEGVINHPYLDSKGLITIGIGFNVDRRQDFMNLNLHITGFQDHSQRPATPSEKQRAYNDLKGFFDRNKKPIKSKKTGKISHGINHRAGSYRDKTHLRMMEKEIMRIALEKIKGFEGELKGKFQHFGCFPAPARIALMDMMWHLGGKQFSKGSWPKFFEAVKNRSWKEAAKQSRRTISGKATSGRNTETYGLFMEAHRMELAALKPASK